MNISLIGTGRMGSRLAKLLGEKGLQFQWGSRNPDAARNKIQELGLPTAKAGETASVLANADLIIHTMWFRDVIPWAEDHREELKGKILVDIVNPFNESFDDFTLDWGTSAAEQLQQLLPETRVVGAFKNTFARVFDQPVHEGSVSDVYVTSDDEQAKRSAIEVFSGTPFRILDAGSLKNNRVIERMTLFERELAIRHGHPGYVAFRLFGSPS